MATDRPTEVETRGEPTPKANDDCETRNGLVLGLVKYLLLLASVVATVTYAVGFSPPGGVWQDTAAGHLAGDPIIRDTHYHRFLVFFYCNAAAFGSSLVVIVLTLILSSALDDKKKHIIFIPLRLVMVLDLLSLIVAYAAGTFRDTLTAVYSWIPVAAVLIFLVMQISLASLPQSSTTGDAAKENGSVPDEEGSSTTGDAARENGSVPAEEESSTTGDAAKENGSVPAEEESSTIGDAARDNGSVPAEEESSTTGDAAKENGSVPAEEGSSTTGDAAKENGSVPAEEKKERLRKRKVLMLLATFAVSVTYVAGLNTPGGFWDSTGGVHRPGDSILKDHHNIRLTVFFLCNTTAFAASLLIVVVLLGRKHLVIKRAYVCIRVALAGLVGAYVAGKEDVAEQPEKESERGSTREAVDKARSLILLLATLAATITYQAGLNPPGGLWQDNGDEYDPGDPILLTTNPWRYRTFFYCNSLSFVTSLVAVVLVQRKELLDHHVLEVAMVFDLLGLIGAYAAGSCRHLSTSIYVMALAGAVLVYVVIHVVLFTLGDKEIGTGTGKKEGDEVMEQRRKGLLLFAILAATITYQAGLTPPGGFRLQDDKSGHHAGDPVLQYNYPRRYDVFFYCNSVSFMLSIALIILLVNPHVYRPAIRTYALSVCTAVGLFGLMGAYAAGSTQHLKTSIYIIALVAAVLFFTVLLILGFWPKLKGTGGGDNKREEAEKKKQDDKKKKRHAKRKYLMLLGVLVASVTYQAGLTPPGGAWQSTGAGHEAGDPVMHDNRRRRYRAFFYTNSISFVASIVVIVLLLPKSMQEKRWWLRAVNATIVLDLLGLLGAYAAGFSRGWKTSAYVGALVIAVLAYIAVHVSLSLFMNKRNGAKNNGTQGLQDGEHQAREVTNPMTACAAP